MNISTSRGEALAVFRLNVRLNIVTQVTQCDVCDMTFVI